MSPSESLPKELDDKYVEAIVKFVSDIRKGKLEGSNNIALATVTLLEEIISDSQNATAFELCGVVRECGRRLSRALPHHVVAVNMVRRVLRAIRDEQRASANQSSEGAGESLQRLVLAAPSRRNTLASATHDLREPLRDHIAELRLELESSTSSICQQAREHIHADELVLTYGASRLTESFLRTASKRCRVILAKSDDVAGSEAMAVRLSACGVTVTVIDCAAVCAVMSRVNKVIVSVAATLPGAALAAPGLAAVACAADYYSVPVIALSPLCKLTPLYSCDQLQLNGLLSPQHTLSYEGVESSVAHSLTPRYDCVRAERIALFITNLGGSSPSYIYRLLSELYDPKDYQL